ncbi:MAG: DUF190 domain-containing protein [Candidatus Omnitrophica bacterium]|nr:DUF190 domain-containing protein [Candidatus Omnitrophota bacterium]
MGKVNENILLKVLVYSNEQEKGIALYERIVLKAKELGLAGVTVVKGMMGFIGEDKIHRPKLASVSERLPVTIEIMDTQQNIDRLLPFIDESIKNGLVALVPVNSLKK